MLWYIYYNYDNKETIFFPKKCLKMSQEMTLVLEQLSDSDNYSFGQLLIFG